MPEIAQIVQELSDAERRVTTLRGQLDEELSDWHEEGASISALSRASGLSRQTVYNAISRRAVANAAPR